MHKHMMEFFKDLDVSMENKGDTLLITVKGEKEKIKGVEKKLNALKDLCSGEEECCGCC